MPQANIDKPIYLALYKLIIYLYTIVRNLPKEYKYSIGQDVLNIGWRTLDLVILTNTIENKEKYKYIEKVRITFNSLKFRLRLVSDLKLLSPKKYAFIIKQSIEISKMLNGWFTWSKRL